MPFTVELDDQNGKIDHYYVVLDKNFAGESAPSEWNAWTSYTYTGLQTMTDADKKLDITINSESALGDHIGFRLYAVNRDGTLVDPDGKAFYVAVGNATTTTSVDVKVRAWVADDQKYVIAELPKTFKPVTCETANSGVAQRKDFDKDGVKSSENASINWRLLKDKDDVDAVIDWKDAKYIKISLQKGVQDFLDDATFSFTIKGEVKTNTSGTVTRVVNTINVNVTKVMPTAELTDFSFKENQLVNGVYTCYLDAVSWATPKWNSTYSENTKGYKNIWNFVTGLDEDKVNDGLSKDFIFTFAKAQWNADDKDYTDSKVVTTRTAKEYILELPQVLIDGKTEHATQIQRNYPGISYRPNKDGVLTAEANYIVDLLECNTIFACPISKTTYSWNQKLTGYTALGAPIYADVNWIEYDSQNGPATTVLAIVDEHGKVTGYENIVKYLAATNTVDPALYTTGKLWNVAFYASDASGNPIVSAKLISNGTQKEDYFLVTVNKNGTFKFTPVSGATNPTADVASTLVITAKDAFGHTYEYELPFTVKKRV